MNKILVAVDGSKFSTKALFKAKQLATALNSEVTILNVIGIWDSVYTHNTNLKAKLGKTELDISEKILKEAEEIFLGFSGKVTTLYKTGDVVDEIVKMAEDGGYDLVVMGSRGAGAFSRTLIGSVSDKVIHHINISVLIIK